MMPKRVEKGEQVADLRRDVSSAGLGSPNLAEGGGVNYFDLPNLDEGRHY